MDTDKRDILSAGNGKMVLYRGSLKSCNYGCSYCPFSKHRGTEKELAKDKEQWFSFVYSYVEQAEKQDIQAIMVTPYGEALIHPWYWEGMARISALTSVEAVGAQTNLGFSIQEALRIFREKEGNLGKLCLWATFHPEMTTVEKFAESCRWLTAEGVKVSAGAVGVPEQAKLLRQLRKELPQDIYLWINRMDGLGRAYTAEEERVFSDIDPYFYRELQPHPADASQCRERFFVQGDGKMRMCNLSSNRTRTCSKKRCTCYLAYGGRKNLVNQMLFGPWPLFRIPRRPKAVFLDIEGTLFANQYRDHERHAEYRAGCREFDAEVQAALQVLAEREKTLLFFATTLPYEDARKRCSMVWHLFSGGVFAGGAYILLNSAEKNRQGERQQNLDRKELFYFLDEDVVEYLESCRRKFHVRMLVYRSEEGRCYKITLLHAHQRPWDRQGVQEVLESLPGPVRSRVRDVTEGRCLQILAAGTGKAAGVKVLCDWLRIPLKDTFAAGDSKEDAEMIKICGSNLC